MAQNEEILIQKIDDEIILEYTIKNKKTVSSFEKNMLVEVCRRNLEFVNSGQIQWQITDGFELQKPLIIKSAWMGIGMQKFLQAQAEQIINKNKGLRAEPQKTKEINTFMVTFVVFMCILALFLLSYFTNQRISNMKKTETDLEELKKNDLNTEETNNSLNFGDAFKGTISITNLNDLNEKFKKTEEPDIIMNDTHNKSQKLNKYDYFEWLKPKRNVYKEIDDDEFLLYCTFIGICGIFVCGIIILIFF
jgi:hypothetical protein